MTKRFFKEQLLQIIEYTFDSQTNRINTRPTPAPWKNKACQELVFYFPPPQTSPNSQLQSNHPNVFVFRHFPLLT